MNAARKMGNVLGGIVESTNNGILPGILLGKCSLWKLPWEKISSQLSNDMTVTFHDKQMFSFKFHYLVTWYICKFRNHAFDIDKQILL